MGNWNITIRGVGVHHNDGRLPEDANRMAAEFVQKLRDAGHTISHASIAFGGEDDLSTPKRYLDDQDAMAKLPQGPRCAKDLGPQIDGDCDAKRGGPFKFCPDRECPVHGVNAPHRACRLVENHEGNCEPPVNWPTP